MVENAVESIVLTVKKCFTSLALKNVLRLSRKYMRNATQEIDCLIGEHLLVK